MPNSFDELRASKQPALDLLKSLGWNYLSPEAATPTSLQSDGGAVLFCPTLQNQDEFNRYRAMLLKPLQTPLKSRKLSFGYKFGLFLTAMFMVLLPMVYIGLIAGLCDLGYEYFMAVSQGTWEYKSRGSIMVLIGIPAALGVAIVVLARPLIWGRQAKNQFSPFSCLTNTWHNSRIVLARCEIVRLTIAESSPKV
ncbi:hypothetical protein FACS1894170_11380 [Planctomycetales bacterium]|nr:hypothetical protein FACS1894170_11380 [Planctomycetales bacterium]